MCPGRGDRTRGAGMPSELASDEATTPGLNMLETTRMSNARFTEEIEFYLPKNNAVFLARIQEQIRTAKYAF